VALVRKSVPWKPSTRKTKKFTEIKEGIMNWIPNKANSSQSPLFIDKRVIGEIDSPGISLPMARRYNEFH
jgi:hypothetical protein